MLALEIHRARTVQTAYTHTHTQNRHCPAHHSTAGHRDGARARVRVGKEKIADCIAINSHRSVINLLAEVSTVDLVQCTKNRWFTLSHNLRKDQLLCSTRTLGASSSSRLVQISISFGRLSLAVCMLYAYPIKNA